MDRQGLREQIRTSPGLCSPELSVTPPPGFLGTWRNRQPARRSWLAALQDACRSLVAGSVPSEKVDFPDR